MSSGQSFEKRSIKDRIILITGASRGIGYDLARKLAKENANLILVSRNKDELENAVNTLKKETQNQQIAGFPCDLSSLSSINSLFKTINEKYTHLDVVINNASIMIGYGEDPLKIDDELEELQFRINVDGYHFVTKKSLPLLFKSKDFERTVLFVSSSAGWLTEPEEGNGMLGYRATKAAENGLMVALHQLYVCDSELSKKIRGENKLHRVGSVHPGFVQTGLGKETGFQNQSIEEIIKAKEKFGAISVDEGSDTLYYLVTAKTIPSGKTWYKRRVHNF